MSIFHRIMEISPTNRLHRNNYKNNYLYSAYWIISRSFVIISLICLIFMDIYLATIMININMNDFGKFYYSAVSLLQGRNIYDINPAMLISVSALEYGIFLKTPIALAPRM